MGDHLLPSCNPLIQHQPNLQSFQTDLSSHDDFLEQMLSSLPNLSWPPHLSNPNPNPFLHSLKPPLERLSDVDALPRFPSLHHDDVDSKLRNSSPMAAAAKSFLLHQQLLLSRAHTPGADAELTRFPLSLVGGAQGAAEGSVQALHNGFPTQQPFQAGAMAGVNQSPASGSTGGGGEAAPRRPRVRARRGQATDPHSIAERLRRERIAERMKALQELVPNANKTDKSSMLDEIIDYVKFLQLQVKVLSMSRLGGAAAHPTEGPVAGCSSSEGMSVAEQQVIKLMEEDMGSAMQYLQGKGLCLMPISLATAISTISNRQQPPPPRPHNPILPFTANANNHGVDQAQPSRLVNGDGFVKKFNPGPQAY